MSQACKFLLFILVGVFGLTETAFAGVIVQTNTIGYSGTWNSSSGSGVIGQRGATLDVFQGITSGPNAGGDLAWLISRDGGPLGWLQYTNSTNPNTNISGAWLNPERTLYGLNVSSTGAYPDGGNLQRLGTVNDISEGAFTSFNLSAVFSGVTPGGFDPNEGFQGSGFTGVSGTVFGTFVRGPLDANPGEVVNFNLTLNFDNNGVPANDAVASFASNEVIPEPATLAAVAAFGIGGLVIRRRRNCQVAA